MGLSKSTKANWFSKLDTNLSKYSSVILVCVDNVSSNQMHQIRLSLRGKGEVLMGKNTMARKTLRENATYEKLLPHVKGNVGFIFTNNDLKEIRDLVLSNKVAAPARAGAIAPNDVKVPPGNTGMEPGKTSFFQALGIPTKIARGTIEIVNEVNLITAGDKVGASEATLLNLLNISPFSYGMVVTQIYDGGNMFESSVLDITTETLLARFSSGLAQVTAIALAANHPTISSVGHTFLNGYKNVMALAIEANYEYPAIKDIKHRIEHPEEYAGQAAAAAPAAAAGDDKKDAAPAAKEEEKEDSEDEDMGFGLFD